MQARAVAAGCASDGEPALCLERFVSCCATLGIAPAAVARLSFLQASRETLTLNLTLTPTLTPAPTPTPTLLTLTLTLMLRR